MYRFQTPFLVSPSLLPVIVAQLVSVVLVFSCSQPVRSF